MLYEEARLYLDQVSKYGSVLGLDSIKELLERLDNPQDKLQFIHIAGTNGKGSTLAYISTILKEAGYKTGRYISPTIMCYRERFQVDGSYISKEALAELTERVKKRVDQMVLEGLPSPTAFEIETAIAFLYFVKENCDIVVLETGLGGLLDATNIVKTVKVCVFTSISRDHMGFLGNTLSQIAENKAGIIKEHAVVVSVPQEESVMNVLQKKAEEKCCQVIVSEPERLILHENTISGQRFSYKEYKDVCIHLLGNYQLENVATALDVIHVLNNMGYTITEESVRIGLEKTRWAGRFQVLQKDPLIIVDGAHNIDAIRRLTENIDIYLKGKKIVAIMGVFKDKEYGEMVKMIAPYLSKVYAVNLPNAERTLSKEALRDEFLKQNVSAKMAETHIEALQMALEDKEDGQVILGFGSLSYLGDMIRKMEGKGR